MPIRLLSLVAFATSISMLSGCFDEESAAPGAAQICQQLAELTPESFMSKEEFASCTHNVKISCDDKDRGYLSKTFIPGLKDLFRQAAKEQANPAQDRRLEALLTKAKITMNEVSIVAFAKYVLMPQLSKLVSLSATDKSLTCKKMGGHGGELCEGRMGEMFTMTYRFFEPRKCSTGVQSVSAYPRSLAKAAICDMIKSAQQNDGCAETLRAEVYQAECNTGDPIL